MADVDPIPQGFSTVSVAIVVPNAREAMEFYERAFGAVRGSRLEGPEPGSTMHGEIRIGDSTIMLTDENEQWGMKAPAAYGGSPVTMHLYVEDVDDAFDRATKAGCEVVFPLGDQFWGDRYGKVRDPYGHVWGLATRIEELSDVECQDRAKAWMEQQAKG